MLNKVDFWLEWTISMAAKPRKCVCVAFRQFRKNAPPSKYRKIDSTNYSVYDPQLTIAGKSMGFLLQDETFKGSHFKFLGRWMTDSLSEAGPKSEFLHKFHELVAIVHNTLIDGFMKLWLCQKFVLGMLSWPLLTQVRSPDHVVSSSRNGQVFSPVSTRVACIDLRNASVSA